MHTSKLITLIFNIVLAALCCFAVYGYAAGPVWKIDATLKLNQTMVDKIEELTSSDASSDNEAYIDALREMADDGIELPITLSLSSKAVYGSVFAKDDSPTDKLIDDAVEAAFNDRVIVEIEKFKESATKSATKTIIKQSFIELSNSEEFKNKFGDKTTDELLQDAGVSEETINEKIDAVYNALTSENTIEEAADEIVDVVADIYDIVKNSKLGEENPEYFEDIDIYDGELKDTVAKTLVMILETSEGNSDLNSANDVTDEMLKENLGKEFNLSSAIDKLLLKLVEGGLGDFNSSVPSAEASKENRGYKTAYFAAGSMQTSFAGVLSGNGLTTLSADASESSESVSSSEESTATTAEEQEDTIEELKASLKQKIKDSLTIEVKHGITVAMKVTSYVLLLCASVWIYLLVKLIVNSITGKMSTKLKIAVIFGWGPAVLLVLIPTIVFRLLSTSNFITQAIFANDVAMLETISEIATLSFSSGTMFALIATVLVIAISIPYMIFRKK